MCERVFLLLLLLILLLLLLLIFTKNVMKILQKPTHKRCIDGSRGGSLNLE